MRTVCFCVLVFLCLRGYADPEPLIRFIENKNQWPEIFHFGTDIPGGKIRFASDHIQFSFHETVSARSFKGENSSPHAVLPDEAGLHSIKVNGHTYRVVFKNSNPETRVFGQEKLITTYNYFVGNDPSRWASRASSYAVVYYEDIYCGIDMRYYSYKGRMKYEWVVKPRVDPKSIALQYDGVDQLYLDNGNLHIETSINEIWEMKPYAYQVQKGEKVEIACRYVLRGNELSFLFPEGYDDSYELIIDPILIFSAYSGSTLDNWGNTATYDAKGNVYSGGMVNDPLRVGGYPVTTGAYQINSAGGNWDIGILKYDSSGSKLLYCTYLGGDDTETPQSLVVDSKGQLLILGATGSENFPVTNGTVFKGGTPIIPLPGVAYLNGTDLFIAKLSEDGTALLGATYLGGTKNDGVNFIAGNMASNDKVESPLARNYGDQLRGDIITDENDFVYIASNTLSSDFPVIGTSTSFGGGSHDAVTAKLKPDLSSIEWSRYIGGSGTDAAYSIRFDKAHNIFIAGGTTSSSMAEADGLFTSNQGNIDGWIQSLTNDGQSIHGTFLGTNVYDQVYFIDLNENDDVFVFGQTKGNYQIKGNVYSNPNSGQFIQKFSHDLKTSGFATVVGTGGNNPNISPTAFLVSDCGYIYLSGWGGTTNNPTAGTVTRNYVGGNTNGMPVTSDAYQASTQGNDFYFMVLSADASQLLYATFLGGSASATHVDGGTSRFDKQGIVYHAVCAGCGGHSDFPAVNVLAAHQKNRSPNCNNAVFKFDLTLLKARLQTNSENLRHPGLNTVCLPDKIVFQNLSVGGKTFEWDFGDGTPVLSTTNKDNIIHEYKATGNYKVTLKAIDPGTCKVIDVTTVNVFVNNAEAVIQDDDAMCRGSQYSLHASGGAQYHWTSQDGSFESHLSRPQVSPNDTTLYYITVTEANGCIHDDTVQLNVIPLIVPEFEIQRVAGCLDTPSVRVKNITDSLRVGDQMFFDFGDGVTVDQEEAAHAFEKQGVYNIKLVGVREFCVTEKTVTLPFLQLVIPNVITPGVLDDKNDRFTIQFGEQKGVTPADYGYKVSLTIYNRWGRKIYEAGDYQYNWSGDDLAAGVYYFEVSIEDHATCRSWVQILK